MDGNPHSSSETLPTHGSLLPFQRLQLLMECNPKKTKQSKISPFVLFVSTNWLRMVTALPN